MKKAIELCFFLISCLFWPVLSLCALSYFVFSCIVSSREYVLKGKGAREECGEYTIKPDNIVKVIGLLFPALPC